MVFTDHIIETNKLAELFGSDYRWLTRLTFDQLNEDCRSLLKLRGTSAVKTAPDCRKMDWSTNSVGHGSACLTKLKDILKEEKKIE
jgi:hypothetical protein